MSFTKGLSDEIPGPSALKKKSYRGGKAAAMEDDEGEEGGDDDALAFAKELRAAIEDGDDEAIVEAFRGLKGAC